ncbi:MAG: hypothetical protein IH614_05845 [Desulfuromonadales bacterium]|nr:hypothetical protein [Desulfuromonadales bacterium]
MEPGPGGICLYYSHDLRSPLTPIIGYTEFLRSEYANRTLDNQAMGMLDVIESQANRMRE